MRILTPIEGVQEKQDELNEADEKKPPAAPENPDMDDVEKGNDKEEEKAPEFFGIPTD